jgi:hypothetical protein
MFEHVFTICNYYQDQMRMLKQNHRKVKLFYKRIQIMGTDSDLLQILQIIKNQNKSHAIFANTDTG